MKTRRRTKLNKASLRQLFTSQRVILAYLFGSTARGTAGHLSDIDIAIMFKDGLSAREQDKRAHKIAREIEKQTNGVEVDIVNLQEVKSSLMKYQIVFSGQRLYAPSVKLARQFSVEVMKEYEDMRYFYDLQFRLMEERARKGAYGTQKHGSKYLEKYVANQ